ncbi:STAS domain-containing protein [Desulfomonile tiedjei]|uniref:Anti-sigma factor antagonist n=1 Tax=Desulfomonile tiedjei (strain ATCC 49306 / DSM 6799 / DCB-1) TaxID=706587 RepID=I4CAE7_DESTA|nr:STAS domain-containing protein [Desulfomonile tiedjei]AFM26538.1 anti-anti-sigma factor [Desulfomonile tiedjei DSM 6799]
MNIQFANEGDWIVVGLEGRMDAVTAPEFEKRMLEHIRQGSAKLILDFSKLEYISSAGLRSVLVTGRSSKARGGDMACCGLQGVVKQVFEISGFQKIVPIFDCLNDALKK